LTQGCLRYSQLSIQSGEPQPWVRNSHAKAL
jgi:hypothetical protein